MFVTTISLWIHRAVDSVRFKEKTQWIKHLRWRYDSLGAADNELDVLLSGLHLTFELKQGKLRLTNRRLWPGPAISDAHM